MKHNAATLTISWFTERDAEQSLTIRPTFQRRLVWADRQKCHLIESILLELPIPEIYVHIQTEPTGKSEYIVVDGQQRINAILEFVGAGGRRPFELSQLDSNSPWIGYTFNDLSDDQKRRFYGHPMAVRNLQEASQTDVEDLFIRLNKYVTALNSQELRNATYKGPFVHLSEQLAEDAFWSGNRLASPDAIRRMRDIEFVSDLLIGVLHGPQSGSPKTLDDYYANLEDYEDEFPQQLDCKQRFLRTKDVIQEIFPDLRTTRWSNRSDFYSLFVATAHLLRKGFLPGENIIEARRVLDGFADAVATYQEDEDSPVDTHVEHYVEALRRGSTDATRRGQRHRALLDILSPLYRDRPQ